MILYTKSQDIWKNGNVVSSVLKHYNLWWTVIISFVSNSHLGLEEILYFSEKERCSFVMCFVVFGVGPVVSAVNLGIVS